jgi:hypothetical protein
LIRIRRAGAVISADQGDQGLGRENRATHDKRARVICYKTISFAETVISTDETEYIITVM